MAAKEEASTTTTTDDVNESRGAGEIDISNWTTTTTRTATSATPANEQSSSVSIDERGGDDDVDRHHHHRREISIDSWREEEEGETFRRSVSPIPSTLRSRSLSFSAFIYFAYHYVMKKHFAEVCLSASVLFIVLSSMFQTQFAMKTHLLQRKAPTPGRFFPRTSPVIDFYDGNGFDVHKLLSMQTIRRGSTGVVFVMYYAPWCARSMEARWHFENLARYFYPIFNESLSSSSSMIVGGPVLFVAVNCWDPNGQCRRSYKLYSYPVFVVYPGSPSGIYYNGVTSADYMFRFLEHVISPMVRLQSDEEADEFLRDFTTSAVAYFDFKTHRSPPGYLAFYGAALRALERDPLRAASKFALITDDRLAARLELTVNGQIRLFRLFNESLQFSSVSADFTSNSKSISNWIFENLINPVRWVSPSVANSGKSDALHEFLVRKPTLILFAPRLPLFDYSPNYNALTTVALQYFDCPLSSSSSNVQYGSVSETIRRLSDVQSSAKREKRRSHEYCLRALREEARLLNDCCEDIAHWTSTSTINRESSHDYHQRNICRVCHPADVQKSSAFESTTYRPRISSFCERFIRKDDFPSDMTAATKEFLAPVLGSRSCDRLINDFLPRASVVEYCCRNDDERDGAGAEQLVKRIKTERVEHSPLGSGIDVGTKPNCEKLRLSRLLRYGAVNLDDAIEDPTATAARKDHPWIGLACRTNRTVQFAAMDRIHYGAFAKKLGLRLANYSSSVAVIFDNKAESVYVLNDPINEERLGQFVVDFTYDRLSRFYRSSSTAPDMGADDRCGLAGSICIRTVTSSNFHSVVMDDKKDVLLFYTWPSCGSCQRLFHVYQTLAYYFRAVQSDILFAQLEISTNDLPWHFTIDDAPALFFFPAGRKSESIAFPNHAPWSLPNLVAFVLAHCQHKTRLRFALSTCLHNSTGDIDRSTTSAAIDTRCLVRNRYRAHRQLIRVQRKIHVLTADVQRHIDEISDDSYWIDDGDIFDEDEWRTYLERTWLDLTSLQAKRRALRSLLSDVLRRNHFKEGTHG